MGENVHKSTEDKTSEDLAFESDNFPARKHLSLTISLSRDIFGMHVWLWLQKNSEGKEDLHPSINKSLNFNFRTDSLFFTIFISLGQTLALFLFAIELAKNQKDFQNNAALASVQGIFALGILLFIGKNLRAAFRIMLVTYFFPKPYLPLKKIISCYFMGILQGFLGFFYILVAFYAIMRSRSIEETIKYFTIFIVLSKVNEWASEFSPDNEKIRKQELIILIKEEDFKGLEDGFSNLTYLLLSLYLIISIVIENFPYLNYTLT